MLGSWLRGCSSQSQAGEMFWGEKLKAQLVRVTVPFKAWLCVTFTAGGPGEERAEPLRLGAKPCSL